MRRIIVFVGAVLLLIAAVAVFLILRYSPRPITTDTEAYIRVYIRGELVLGDVEEVEGQNFRKLISHFDEGEILGILSRYEMVRVREAQRFSSNDTLFMDVNVVRDGIPRPSMTIWINLRTGLRDRGYVWNENRAYRIVNAEALLAELLELLDGG